MLTATTVITRRARRQSIRSEGAGNISSAPSRNYTEFGRYQLVQSRTTGALYAWSTISPLDQILRLPRTFFSSAAMEAEASDAAKATARSMLAEVRNTEAAHIKRSFAEP